MEHKFNRFSTHMTKRHKLILLLTCINGAVFSGFGYYRMMRNSVSPVERQVAEQMVSFKVMPAEQYLKISQIQKSIISTHSISDSDLDWSLEEMQRASSPNLITTSLRRLMIIAEWKYLVDVTPEQREKLFQTSCQYLPHVGSRYLTTDDKLIGLDLSRIARIRRSIPFILPLLQDRDPNICKIARLNLLRLGYKI